MGILLRFYSINYKQHLSNSFKLDRFKRGAGVVKNLSLTYSLFCNYKMV
jgi:hypothetical protein